MKIVPNFKNQKSTLVISLQIQINFVIFVLKNLILILKHFYQISLHSSLYIKLSFKFNKTTQFHICEKHQFYKHNDNRHKLKNKSYKKTTHTRTQGRGGLKFSKKEKHNFTIIHQDFFFFKWYDLDFVYLFILIQWDLGFDGLTTHLHMHR